MSIPTIREIEESEEWLEDIEDIIKKTELVSLGGRLETRKKVWHDMNELRVSDLKTVRSLRTIRAILKEKKCSA